MPTSLDAVERGEELGEVRTWEMSTMPFTKTTHGDAIALLKTTLDEQLDLVEFVVPRTVTDETTVGVVRARVPRALQAVRPFRDALARAMTDWVRETSEGQDIWKRSRNHISLDTLVTVCERMDLYAASLTPRLARYGVHDLEVAFHGHDEPVYWTYDELLVDDTRL